jgi:hypothetical protein
MAFDASDEAEEIERWNRISMHVRAACALVERDGKNILIKFDGERENDEIYTIVLDFGGATSSRVDSNDLEETLSRLFVAGISGATPPTEDFAEALRSFDMLAKQGFVVGLIIMRVGQHLEFEIFLSGDDKAPEPMERRGPIFAEVAAQIIEHAGQAR